MSNENLESKLTEAAEAAEEKVEEAVAAAEDVVEEAAETVEEKAEEAVNAAENVAEEAAEAAEEKAAAVKTKAAPKSAPVIKKKKGINTTTLIVIIVCAVVVLACLWFVGFKLGWWQKASYKIAPHDTIEISESDVEITEESIDTYVTRFQDAYATTEEVTTGTVEDGDTVYISFEGRIDGETFEGGTSDGYELTIGSGSFIDGFEDGLIGVEVGETVMLDLVFPEDYDNADLAGKDVTFETTVLHKDVTVTPEFTDDFVKENSAAFTEDQFSESVQLDTVDAYRSYIKDYLYDIHLDDALEDAIDELIEVKQYDGTTRKLFIEDQENNLAQTAAYYSMDADTLASYYGYENAEAYATEQGEYQLKLAMLYSALAKEIGVTHTPEEVDASLAQYIEDNGYTDYSLEEVKEQYGKAGMYWYENYQMNYEPVMDAMRERVVIVPATEEETAEETSAAE